MKKSKYLAYGLLAVVVIISQVSYLYYSSNKRKEIFNELIQEYSPLVLEDSLGGYVSEINHPYVTEINNDPHQAFVTFTPYKKKTLMVGYELGNQMTLDETLRVGDYVYKKQGRKTLSVVRANAAGDSLKFYFEITDYLGYPVKPG